MQRADHVIIRGHVFTYEEKQPFMPSGESVLGALEYNQADDTTKCHECGEWFSGLGWHVTKSHGITVAEYNKRHGLRKSSALCGMKIRESHRKAAKRLTVPGSGILSSVRGKRARPKAKSMEWHNEMSRCDAQLLFRIQMTAATVGHTPNRADLQANGVQHGMLVRAFGSIDNAMKLADLEPNGVGGHATPLPRAFPPIDEIKKRWNSRMPWPEDYFKTESSGTTGVMDLPITKGTIPKGAIPPQTFRRHR